MSQVAPSLSERPGVGNAVSTRAHGLPMRPAAGCSSRSELCTSIQNSFAIMMTLHAVLGVPGRTGAMVVEFPAPSSTPGAGSPGADSGSWLVLGLQPGAFPVDQPATLVLYMAPTQEGPRDLRLVSRHPLPNATFIALDVTKAVSRVPQDTAQDSSWAGPVGRTSRHCTFVSLTHLCGGAWRV